MDGPVNDADVVVLAGDVGARARRSPGRCRTNRCSTCPATTAASTAGSRSCNASRKAQCRCSTSAKCTSTACASSKRHPVTDFRTVRRAAATPRRAPKHSARCATSDHPHPQKPTLHARMRRRSSSAMPHGCSATLGARDTNETVVITITPTRHSIHPRFADSLNACFVSDAEHLLRAGRAASCGCTAAPPLTASTTACTARVVCNPQLRCSDGAFDPDFCVRLGAPSRR